VTVGRKKRLDPNETATILGEEDEEFQRLLNFHGSEHLDYLFWDVTLCCSVDRYQHFRGT
jgi:hypothetical protein